MTPRTATPFERDPSAVHCTGADLLALCLCLRHYVRVSPAAVFAGDVYCHRCAPYGLVCAHCGARHRTEHCGAETSITPLSQAKTAG